MGHSFRTLVLCAALAAASLPHAAVRAQGAAEAAATCANDDTLPPEQMLGICGLVIGSTAAPPDRVHALIVRAGLQLRLEQVDLAVADGDLAVQLDPLSAAALEARGKALAAGKKFDRALDDFDRAIRLRPNEAQLFASRAATFASMHENRLAVRDYNEAVRLDPNAGARSH